VADHSAEFEPLPTRIIRYPDPVLARPASPVTAFDDELHAFLERMIELMRESEGVGLAAPQVGVSRRIFVAEPEPGPESVPVVFINPELELGGGLEPFEEGCLSIPEVRVMVRRPSVVRIRALDLDGAPFELEDDAFPARVWQHEFDHLEGVLITDRMSPRDRLTHRKRLKAMREDFEDAGR
jgi:peptide deformylase